MMGDGDVAKVDDAWWAGRKVGVCGLRQTQMSVVYTGD